METYSLKQFNQFPDTGVLAADMSDLKLRHLPEQIKIKSHITGRVITFTRAEVFKDVEGDLSYAVYRAEGTRYRVELFND